MSLLIQRNNLGIKAQITEDSAGYEVTQGVYRGSDGTEFSEKQSLEVKRLPVTQYCLEVAHFWISAKNKFVLEGSMAPSTSRLEMPTRG